MAKIHRNIALGIVEGLDKILSAKEALRPSLNYLLKKNKKWGSRDRRLLGEAVLDCVRWKRSYEHLADIDPESKFANWELFGVWLTTKKIELPLWEEFSRLQQHKINPVQGTENTARKIRESLPDWLDQLGISSFEEGVWEKESKSLNTIAPLVLRCNTLKKDTKTLRNYLKTEFNIESSQLPDIPEALLLENHHNLNQNVSYLNGEFEIQDANSQQVARWANPKTNQLIIDSCAGSGGKSLHMAAIMKNKGQIIALDPHQKKLEQLHKRAQRNGVSIIKTYTTTQEEVYVKYTEMADVVLIDAPCSGLGTLRRNPAAKWTMNLEKIESLKLLQQSILQKNAPLTKKGGILVYATCSIFPGENQNQISEFLNSKVGSDFKLEKEQTFLTHKTNFDGFYIALLKKHHESV